MPRYEEHQLDALASLILEKSFILPGLNCGACGHTTCGGLTQAIVSGNATPLDCKAKSDAIDVCVNGQSLGLNPFTASILAGGIQGMLASLKGYVHGAEVTIKLK